MRDGDFVLVQVVQQARRSYERATGSLHVSLAALELRLDCDIELARQDAVAKGIAFNIVADCFGNEGFCENLARQNTVACLFQRQPGFQRRHTWVSVIVVVS